MSDQAHTRVVKGPTHILPFIGVASLLAIILPVIWTRHLASAVKAAVTIILVFLFVATGVGFAIYGFFGSTRARFQNASSDNESSLSDD